MMDEEVSGLFENEVTPSKQQQEGSRVVQMQGEQCQRAQFEWLCSPPERSSRVTKDSRCWL